MLIKNYFHRKKEKVNTTYVNVALITEGMELKMR